jgi:hypothetical protein
MYLKRVMMREVTLEEQRKDSNPIVQNVRKKGEGN